MNVNTDELQFITELEWTQEQAKVSVLGYVSKRVSGTRATYRTSLYYIINHGGNKYLDRLFSFDLNALFSAYFDYMLGQLV